MNVLIVGGPGTFLNNILIKCHKEGHKVSVLTGNRFTEKDAYPKCFEVYPFPYDASCLNEIFDSAAPDVTIFMGAFDTNFKWENEETDAVKYTASLANVLMGYVMRGKGRFIYISSHEVFGDNHDEEIIEIAETSPDGFKAQAIFQGETLCANYRSNRDLDIIIVRTDHLYNIPEKRDEVNDTVTKMCLEVLENKSVHYTPGVALSPLYERDAVEALHRLITCTTHHSDIYQLSSSRGMTEEALANLVRERMNPECDVISNTTVRAHKCVLSNRAYESEFGNPFFVDLGKNIEKIGEIMKSKPYVFMTGEDDKIPLWMRIKEKGGWLFRAVVPFIENFLVFIPCFFFYDKTGSSLYFANLDIYLLYVLLFAIIFGQQQATLSALLAVVGYFITNTADRSGFELLLDGNTYVWIAQLFIVGLSVGYMRDQINKIKQEQEEEKDYLEQQVEDIQDINSTNARVKNVLETQLVNQSDSVGKIYSITSSLDQYSPEEVLFYAAETIGKIMKTDDVAIYVVSNADYARLFSSTSEKARSLGNSIRYTEMGVMYESLISGKVFINRKMESSLPLMANAIFENGQMQIIVMVWGLSWENMTLGQSNQLVVVSSLIQNAVLRSNRFIAALEDKRYMEGTKLLETESFRSLLDAFIRAEEKGLNECTVIKIKTDELRMKNDVEIIQAALRQSDYFGTLGDGNLYALLSNTNEEAAQFVLNRFKDKGLVCEIAKGLAV